MEYLDYEGLLSYHDKLKKLFTYKAGTNITIDENNTISATCSGTGEGGEGGVVYTPGNFIDITNNVISTTYSAGSNISISDTGVISATDTTYSAGDNVSIDGTVINATDTTYTAGRNITIEGNVISALGDVVNTEEYNQALRVLIHAILKSYKKHDHLECINKAIAVALHELKQFELLWENEL